MPGDKRSGSKGIPHHPLVTALAPDPGKPPTKATKLFGYPGPAAEKGAIRLWLDADLTAYVDIPGDAILHSQTLPDDQGTYIWVDPAATLTYSSAQSHEVQAEFLGGPIAARNLAGAAPVGGGGGGANTFNAAACSVSAGCSVLPDCGETVATVCPSALEPLCGQTVETAATICPTRFPECPPQVSVPTNCPTVFPHCRISLATQCPTFRPAHCPPFHSRVDICTTATINERFVSQVVRCPTPPEICRPYVTNVGPCPSVGIACPPPTDVSVCCAISNLRCPTIGGCVTIPCARTLDCGIVGPFRPQEQ